MTKYTKHQYANNDYISEFIVLRFMVSQWNPDFDSLVTLDELFARHAINERKMTYEVIIDTEEWPTLLHLTHRVANLSS